MNEEQKAIAEDIFYMFDQGHITTVEALTAMAALLQEMIDESEPKSCGWIRAIDEAMVTHHLGVADIADDYEAAKKKLNALLCLNQDIGEYFSAKAPTPSVPDGWRPFLTDVITAAGLLEHGKRDKGLAGRIGKFAFDAMRAAPTPAEPSADVVRDAERYRWLRTYNTANHPAVTEAFFWEDEDLGAEIDAAIAAEKGGA